MMPSDETTEILEQRKRVKMLKEVHAVQGTDGNWNSDRYMRGMFNGLELGMAIMEDRDVSYKEPPAEYLHEPNPQNFLAMLKHMLNYSGWDSAVGVPDFLLAELITHILQGMEVAHDKQVEMYPKMAMDSTPDERQLEMIPPSEEYTGDEDLPENNPVSDKE